MTRAFLAALARTLALLVPLAFASCGKDSGAAEVTAEVVLARDRAADHGARAEWEKARDDLRPLVSAKDAAAEDLLRAAQAELAIESEKDSSPVVRATPFVERAAKGLAADDAVLKWCRYRLATLEYDLPREVAVLRELLALRPGDFLVEYTLACALDDLDTPEAKQEAIERLKTLLRIASDVTGGWRMGMLHRLATALQRQGKSEEAAPLFADFQLLDARKVKNPGKPAHQPGTLGAIAPHTPGLFEIPAPKAPAGELVEKPLAASGAAPGSTPLWFAVLQLEWKAQPADAGVQELYSFTPDQVIAFGPKGVQLTGVAGEVRTLHEGAVVDLVPLDRMDHGADKSTDAPGEKEGGDRDPDLLFVTSAEGRCELRCLENVGGTWSLREEVLATLPPIEGPGRLTTVDYDHDGDVDVLATTSAGPRLLRNDGFQGTGGFTDASEGAGLPSGDLLALTEDFDNDSDVDVLFVEHERGVLHLASNERGGRFSDASKTLPPSLHGTHVVPADFDADGWVDLAVFGTGTELALYTRSEVGGWRAEARRFTLASTPTGMPRAEDWDLDGTTDLLWPCAGSGAAGLLAPGFAAGGVAFALAPLETPVPGTATLAVVDLDGDHDLDLVRLDAAGLRCFTQPGAGHGVALAFQGHKDNARGIGTVVELRSGLVYRRFYYRGGPVLAGFSGKPIDVVRAHWPNGVVQGNFGFQPGDSRLIAQRLGQVGSCPFLYTWNGTTYEFISDVLGITPLGLPMAPGMPGSSPMMVPPDHDEYVLVKGEQLVPKDGVYELHFTEELREVTYLDRIRLDVVDHPADVEVFPNERFTFPPFPEAHTHTVKDALVPLRAVDQAGQDWTEELARDDRSFAIPFEALDGSFRGLATPHSLELAFDPERVRSAAKLRLFLNGWFYWTDASVNMAAAFDPDVEFVPPLLSVPDGNGGWKDCGPIGFPAGKLKTMAVDVSALVNRADPRIRLFSTLRLYWDSIRLATDADDAPLVTTALEPLSAQLWQRGFSRSFPLLGEHECEWFVWDELEPEGRWDQHPGLYTKLGETVPLLGAIDDRFVIMGAGDALTVRFDATKLPPLPAGWRRDYLVFLDGWAKDRDPNTVEALYVEPLPFHGMSGYPYRADERYPDDELHRAYRREWNTRPATRWIESLVPAGRASATSTMPASSSTPASTTGSVMRSPSTSTPAVPATSG